MSPTHSLHSIIRLVLKEVLISKMDDQLRLEIKNGERRAGVIDR